MGKKLEEIDLTASKEGMSFLNVKNLLLLNYNKYLNLFCILKLKGEKIEGHPVVKRLIHLRLLIEKMKPLDWKMEFQIKRQLDMTTQPVW